MGVSRDSPVQVGCGVLVGVDAVPVTVEATMRGDNARLRVLGSVDGVVKEACFRVLSAFAAQGLDPPRGAPMLNFVPAGVRKAGAGFDLPMALALAGAGGILPRRRLEGLCAFGEISLEGRVLPVRGVVAVALAARERGWRRLLTGPDDAARAAVVPGIDAVAVTDLRAAIRALALGELRAVRPPGRGDCGDGMREALLADTDADFHTEAAAAAFRDLCEIRGQETAKTALAVAAAGRHNLLMVGPPGSGKTALAQRIGGILPPAGTEECLEILKIHSAHATGPSAERRGARFTAGGRPFRAPHHSSTAAALLGGGADPRPGEATLAQHGVLFLDELPEFRRDVLEGLRQPIEDGRVTVGRAARTVTMPADFLLIAAMNPCPCGHIGDPAHPCVCPAPARQRYHARVSGPLLDRFDLCVDVPTLPPERFREPVASRWTTAHLRGQVLEAFDRQRRRNQTRGRGGFVPNGRLEGRELERAVGADPRVFDALEHTLRAFRLSGRARTRLLRTARTVADLDGRDAVTPGDVRKAATLRGYAFRS